MIKFSQRTFQLFVLIAVVLLSSFNHVHDIYALNPEVEALLEILEQKGILTAQESEEYKLLVEQKSREKEKDQKTTDKKKLYNDDKSENRWIDNIVLSGAVEFDSASERHRFKDPEGPMHSRSSINQDFSLATVELGADIEITPWSRVYVLVDYEEDEDESLVIDEAYFVWGGEETEGFYCQFGRYYPHFGEQYSFLVSDPQTVEIFEARENAIEIGLRKKWLSVAIGIFDGDVESDFSDEKRLGGWYADVNVHNSEGSLAGGGSFSRHVVF